MTVHVVALATGLVRHANGLLFIVKRADEEMGAVQKLSRLSTPTFPDQMK